MKKLLLITLLSMSALLSGCTTTESDKISIAVTIIPQKAFVEAVAGDLVDVVTVIPPGNSPANYDPDAKTMTEIMSSDIYFTIGVPTEEGNILGELNDMKVVHLEDMVAEKYPDRYFGEAEEHEEEDHDEDEHSHEGRDPHIWLSIKRVIYMTEIIRDELIKLDPDNEETYKTNAASYIADLEALDLEIKDMYDEFTMKTFIIYHPSFGYFADDYGLDMMELEEDGKDATSQNLTDVIDFARDNNIKTVFYQSEISSTQVNAFADELDANKVQLNPLSEDYINNFKSVAEEIKKALH